MPLFEFRCRSCDHTYQVIARHNDSDKASCPRCGSTDKDRVFRGTSVPQKKDSCNIRFG